MKYNKREYFVREFDETKVTASKSLIGKFFIVRRHISRVGYMFEPIDMPHDEVYEKENEILLNVLRIGLGKLDEKKADRLLRVYRDHKLPMPTYKARGAVAASKRKEVGNDALWRRFWFVDFKDVYPYKEEGAIEITGIKRCMTGAYYAPSYSTDWETGIVDDYDPGGLAPGFHQSIYIARNRFDYFQFPQEIYIHPMDLSKEEQLITDKQIYQIKHTKPA